MFSSLHEVSINKNRHAIKHKFNYEIAKDTKMDFRYMLRDHARISKTSYKSGKIKTCPGC